MNTDTSTAISKVNLNSSEVAICIKKFDNSNKIGLYIPTLMSEINMQNKPYDKTVNLNNNILKNKNKNFSFEKINICNYYTAEPYNPAIYHTDINIGEKVRLKILDNDIKKCFYYENSYKITDALMDNNIKMEKQILDLTNKIDDLEKRLNNLEDIYKNDTE